MVKYQLEWQPNISVDPVKLTQVHGPLESPESGIIRQSTLSKHNLSNSLSSTECGNRY